MLSFALGSIPVRIHLSFWLTAAFLGMNMRDPLLLLVWVAIVFISVLLHELGHALMGKVFGLDPQIELYAFGGATSWERGNDLSSGKRILISLAGPFAGLALAGVTMLVATQTEHMDSPVAIFFVKRMLFVNVVWSIFNLVPILPLDGGNVMAHTFAIFTRGGGRVAAHVVSIVVAVGLGAYMLIRSFDNLFPAMWLGLFAFQNIRALQPAQQESQPPPARQKW